MERIQRLCRHAVETGCSDLFFNEGARPCLRRDGRLEVAEEQELARADLEAFWAACGSEDTALPGRDTHFTSDEGVRFRVNLHRHIGRLGAVLRTIANEVPPMEDLGLPCELLRPWISKPSGLVLIAGPTGSGKSTTVASMLAWLNDTADRHIVTIEDPIEFLFQSRRCLFTQHEVPTDTASFVSGLRSALRQSPDVIFVGEIRDFETANIALQASETGHLVISTLHSATVSETMERLTHLMPPSVREGTLALLAAQLTGILCQRLLPAVRAGRVLITENLTNAGATRPWIQKAAYPDLVDFMERGGTEGNQAFVDAIFDACRDGRIAEETALDASPRPLELQRALRGISNR